MSHQQQMIPPRASANGLAHLNLDREGSGRHENKSWFKKSSSGSFSNAGKLGHASSTRDRLIYVMTQLIGYHVDVHVMNGSVISGIFHATNTEKDFGIVLKMAQLTKDGSVSGQRAVTDFARKPQTMIIPARELVQVLAKDIALGGDELLNGPVHDKRKEIMIDSAISYFHRSGERELERWAPDEEDSEFIELEKYDKKWNRSWDQFETNAALFGVKSTFNEEIYTTKLERGPHMREVEKQATRIAREIENEVTEDIHLAEERGLDLDEDLDQDEEIKYSAVRRDVESSSSFNLPANAPSTTCAFDSFIRTDNNEQEELPACSSADKDDSGGKDNENVQSEKYLSEGGKPSISEDLKNRPSRSHASDSVGGNKYSGDKLSSAAENVNTSQQTGNSTSSASERVTANSVSSTPGLSPSSSMVSLSSEKSSLNPNAKEFKLNPNAKSFTPSSPLRPPQPPASDGSFYYPNNVPTVPLGPGLPMGTGDFFEDVGPLLSLQLGGSTMDWLLKIFNSYVNLLISALPGSMDDEANLEGLGNKIVRMAETEEQQLALLANASLLAEELLPRAAMKLSSVNQASMDDIRKRGPDKQNRAAEQREWKKKLHRMVDKLRDSFCRQHALDLIFTEEGDTHLSAEMYINMDNTVEEPEWVPSVIFQELYAKLNRMASIAAYMFVGRERFATLLMMRLTETVILWLSEDQSFWEEIEEGPRALGPLGLQQFYLDMQFVILFGQGRFLSRHVHQVILDIIDRAMAAFSATGMNPDSVLPSDDWFVDVAHGTISRISGKARVANGEREVNSPTASVSAQSMSSVRSHGSS